MKALQLDQVLFVAGDIEFTRADVAVIAAALMFLCALLLLIAIWRGARRRNETELIAQSVERERAHEAQMRIAELVATQNELNGRLASVQENVASGQQAFSKQLDERLANVTGRVSQSLSDTNKTTQESLSKLQERLAVIDTAQNNIQSLAQDVVGLQAILQNKQTRGAFGQSRMETIVQDGLPMGAYEFQATLSNGKRPDCLVPMPNKAPSLVIDAKFPLEGWTAFREAQDPQAKKEAAIRFRKDMEVHIGDISAKYLIPGETQDTAFLFVPSESIFAEVHEQFDGIVQKAHTSRVVIVSPSLLMLSIQVIQAVLKDARMREQAHLIQGEVMKFSKDLALLDERIGKLKSHHDLTGKDIDQILISARKLSRHGERIEALEFGAAAVQDDEKGEVGKPFLRAIEGGD